jgi:hypothetical protein
MILSRWDERIEEFGRARRIGIVDIDRNLRSRTVEGLIGEGDARSEQGYRSGWRTSVGWVSDRDFRGTSRESRRAFFVVPDPTGVRPIDECRGAASVLAIVDFREGFIKFEVRDSSADIFSNDKSILGSIPDTPTPGSFFRGCHDDGKPGIYCRFRHTDESRSLRRKCSRLHPVEDLLWTGGALKASSVGKEHLRCGVEDLDILLELGLLGSGSQVAKEKDSKSTGDGQQAHGDGDLGQRKSGWKLSGNRFHAPYLI